MGWIRREGSGHGEKWVDLRSILDLGLGELDNGLQVESMPEFWLSRFSLLHLHQIVHYFHILP